MLYLFLINGPSFKLAIPHQLWCKVAFAKNVQILCVHGTGNKSKEVIYTLGFEAEDFSSIAHTYYVMLSGVNITSVKLSGPVNQFNLKKDL